jgi:hypothetical protein
LKRPLDERSNGGAIVGCGAGRETIRFAPASRARSLSAPRHRAAVCTRAIGPSGPFSSVEAFREQLAAAVPIDQVENGDRIATVQNSLTELTSTAASRSKDIYSQLSHAVGNKVPSVEELSSNFTEKLASVSGAASSASSDLLAFSSALRAQATEKLSVLTEKLSSTAEPARYTEQISELSSKVQSLTSEFASKSSDVSTQLTNALQKQLESAPELQARFAASADALAQSVNNASSSVTRQASSLLNSEGISGVTDKFDGNFDAVKSFVSSGQVADLLATPEGIGAAAVATAGVLFSVLFAGFSDSFSRVVATRGVYQ